MNDRVWQVPQAAFALSGMTGAAGSTAARVGALADRLVPRLSSGQWTGIVTLLDELGYNGPVTISVWWEPSFSVNKSEVRRLRRLSMARSSGCFMASPADACSVRC